VYAKRLGSAIVTTGIGHNLLGGYLYRKQLAGMVKDRVINSASDARLGTVDGERRQAALWYFVGGLAMITMGMTIRRADPNEGIAPALGPGLTAIGSVGAATMPMSGFWLVLAEGIAAMALRRRNVSTVAE
jgi:Family of unknown function (DUF6463)